MIIIFFHVCCRAETNLLCCFWSIKESILIYQIPTVQALSLGQLSLVTWISSFCFRFVVAFNNNFVCFFICLVAIKLFFYFFIFLSCIFCLCDDVFVCTCIYVYMFVYINGFFKLFIDCFGWVCSLWCWNVLGLVIWCHLHNKSHIIKGLGMNVNTFDRLGMTPLHRAAQR